MNRALHAYVLNFPVVVCHSFSAVWALDFYEDSDPERVAENFQLDVRYAYAGPSNGNYEEHFLLDFVEFGQLPKFIEAIEQTVAAAQRLAGNG